jgi:hypothetical protein
VEIRRGKRGKFQLKIIALIKDFQLLKSSGKIKMFPKRAE